MGNISARKRFDLNRSGWSRWVLLSLVLLSLAATLDVQIPLLQDRYKIGDDLRHLYWMTGFQDPELFPNDYLHLYKDRYYIFHLGGTRLMIEQQAPGYSLLFYLASFLMDSILFSKILPFVLMPIYVAYLFKIGQRLKGNTCGLLLGLLGIAFGLGFPGAIRTGYQRGFAFPLTAVFLYYALVESGVGVAVSLVLQGLFYAPTLPVSSIAYVLSWVRFDNGRLRVELARKKIIAVLSALLIVAVTLSPVAAKYVSIMQWSSATSTEESGGREYHGLLDNPAYGVDGRDAVFAPNRMLGIPLYLIVGFAGLIPNYGVAANLAPLFLLCGLILLCVGAKSLRLGRHVWSLFSSGLLCFVLAWVAGFIASTFALNMPNKYVKVTIPLTTMVFIGCNLEEFVTSLLVPRWKRVFLAILLVGAGGFMLLVARYFSPVAMISKVSADNEIAVSCL